MAIFAITAAVFSNFLEYFEYTTHAFNELFYLRFGRCTLHCTFLWRCKGDCHLALVDERGRLVNSH